LEKHSKISRNSGKIIHRKFRCIQTDRDPNSQRSLPRLRIKPRQLHLPHQEPVGVGPRGARLRRRNAGNIAHFRPKRRRNGAEVVTVLQGRKVQIQSLTTPAGDAAEAAVETDSHGKPDKPSLREKDRTQRRLNEPK